jgi:hypothetical protein
MIMPIKAENKARYPANWQKIRERILKRAGNCCEQCKAPNGVTVLRGIFRDKDRYQLPDGEVRDAENGWLVCLRQPTFEGLAVKIVLTIAHLDHVPEHCDDDNLKALCQLHHLRYDAKHHAETARQTRRARLAIGDLFA